MLNNDSIAIFVATNGWIVRFVTWESDESDKDEGGPSKYEEPGQEQMIAPRSVIRSMRQEAKVFRAVCYTREETLAAVRGYAHELGPMPPLSVHVMPGVRPFDGLYKPWGCITRVGKAGFQIETCSSATFMKEAKEVRKDKDGEDPEDVEVGVEPDRPHTHKLHVFKTLLEFMAFLTLALPDPESPHGSVPPTAT